MLDSKRSTGLQTIFSFFLGLMVAAFVGVGVYTFHPPPQPEFDRQIRELSREEQEIRNRRPPDDLTADDRSRIQGITDERNSLSDASNRAREAWGRSTSIVLIVFATLVMAVSLIRADHLAVISNGLLLGGVFTMVYGVGWIIASDASVVRFFVMTAALVITLGLGYVRFVHQRGRSAVPVAVGAGAVPDDFRQRLEDLEDRISQAAGALARNRKDG